MNRLKRCRRQLKGIDHITRKVERSDLSLQMDYTIFINNGFCKILLIAEVRIILRAPRRPISPLPLRHIQVPILSDQDRSIIIKDRLAVGRSIYFRSIKGSTKSSDICLISEV